MAHSSPVRICADYLIRLYCSFVFLCHIKSMRYVRLMDSRSKGAQRRHRCDLAFFSVLAPFMLFTGVSHTSKTSELFDIKRLIEDHEIIQSNYVDSTW
jgi:hypothetical protein